MRHRTSGGFTLVELMVVVLIVAILAAIAFPSFEATFRSNRMATASNELLGAISLARTEAIRSTRSAGVCGANADGTACVAGADWSNGLLVWTNSSTATPDYGDTGDVLVRYIQPKPQVGLTVPASGAGGALANRLIFDSRGRATDNPAGGRVMTMKPSKCPVGRDFVRTLTVNQVGQVISAKANCT